MAPACFRFALIHGRRRRAASVARPPLLAGRGLGPQDLFQIGVRKRTSFHRGRGPHPTGRGAEPDLKLDRLAGLNAGGTGILWIGAEAFCV